MAITRTIDQQVAYGNQIHLSNTNLSFHEMLYIKEDEAIEVNKMVVYTDYMFHLKNRCSRVFFTEQTAKKYAYRPKMLAWALYKNVELYSLILRLNHMKLPVFKMQ